MRIIVEHLLILQKMILQSPSSAPEHQTKIAELRKSVPAPVLAHFDRMVSRGKNGAALVRHGVCSECHIRVPVGTLVSLVAPKDVYLCDTCGCYLLLPAEERESTVNPAKSRPAARRIHSKPVVPETAPAAPWPSLISPTAA